MKKLSTTILIIIFSCAAFAQQSPIAVVSSSGVTKLYNSFTDAVNNANTNDIVYLPGGSFATDNITVAKKITLIGVGHNPDSSAATQRTFLSGNINLSANGSVVDGVFLSGDFGFNADTISVFRCNFNSSSGGVAAKAILIDECAIRYKLNTGQIYYNMNVRNSIINNGADFTGSIVYSIFENCIFLQQTDYDFSGGNDNNFQSCIFPNITGFVGNQGGSNNFLNNIFAAETLPSVSAGYSLSNNIVNENAATTFTKVNKGVFDYDQVYTLKTGSKAIKSGVGGIDMGVYGGTTPWVTGNIPPTPHIYYKSVAGQTNTNGTLHVEFKVKP